MVFIHVWVAPMVIVIGIVILYFQYSLFSFFYKAYKILEGSDLKLLSYAFFSFVIATLLLISLNGASFYMYQSYGYRYMEFYREIGVFLYDLFFAIGLLLLILLSRRVSTVLDIALLPVIPLITQITLPLTIVELVIIVETGFLIYLYLSKGSKAMFTGRLWLLSLIFILGSRVISILPFQPLSDVFSILMDLLAFLTLYLMKLELELQMEGRRD